MNIYAWLFLKSYNVVSVGRVLIWSALMLFVLSGCGGGDSQDADPTPADDVPESPDPEPVTRAIELQWDAPFEREDGSALSMDDIGGYEISFRREGATQFNTRVIDDSSVSTYLINDLEAGDYEIFIYTFDLNSVYSLASSIIEVTI